MKRKTLKVTSLREYFLRAEYYDKQIWNSEAALTF